MSRPSDNRPADSAVVDLLRSHHHVEPDNLEHLAGGFWSAAYGYRIGDEELVLRIGDEPDGFRDDQRAMAYASPHLPVPEILAIGEGFGRWFAVSRRHHGRFLNDIGPDQSDVAGPTVADLLAALRSVPRDDTLAPPWRTWLLDAITDRPDHHTRGWRSKIASNPAADRTFRAAERRIRSTIEACEDRGQLVHSDLLHNNVLVSPGGDAVTAVFSWKCSTWGDGLYDLAWCTFWGRWYPGIGALRLWDRVVPRLEGTDAVDVGIRHHVYELQIAANHVGWYATIGDDDGLSWTVRQLDEVLEQGPRHGPADPAGPLNPT